MLIFSAHTHFAFADRAVFFSLATTAWNELPSELKGKGIEKTLFVMVILLLNALLIRGILFLTLLCCPNLLLPSDIKLTKCIFLIIVDCDN